MSNLAASVKAFASLMDVRRILAIDNVEFRRAMLESAGAERLFSQGYAKIVHEDSDDQNNPRALLHVECNDALDGILAACRVVCPSTGRVYHILVDPAARTCQEAIDGTFQVVGTFVERHT